MENKKRKKIFFPLLLLVISSGVFFLGYNLGHRTEIKYVEKIKWVKGETVYDTIRDVNFIEIVKNDTLIKEIKKRIKDTTELKNLIENYCAEKKYELDFSHDTIGEVKIGVTVSENEIKSATSKITPLIKTIETTKWIEPKVKLFQFYVNAGTSFTFDTQQLEFGTIVKDRYVISASGIRLKKNFSYTVNFGIKF